MISLYVESEKQNKTNSQIQRTDWWLLWWGWGVGDMGKDGQKV